MVYLIENTSAFVVECLVFVFFHHQKWDRRYVTPWKCEKLMENDDAQTAANAQAAISVDEVSRLVAAAVAAATKRLQTENVNNSDQFALPVFDPYDGDVLVWLSEIEELRDQCGWSDRETVLRSCGCLRGSARKWHDSWRQEKSGKDWESLKAGLLEAFPVLKQNGRWLREAANYESAEAATYGEYARLKITKHRRVDVKWPEHVLIEAVIHGISDKDLRTAAEKQQFNSLSDLSRYLNSCGTVHTHRRKEVTVTRSSSSRRRCYACHRSDHLLRDCPTVRASANNKHHTINMTKDESPMKRIRLIATCSYCKKEGHSIENCWAKLRAKRDKPEKAINFCRTGRQQLRTTAVVIKGVVADCLLDTGATQSLITERLALQLDVCYTAAYANLTGIGNSGVIARTKISTVVEFENLACEVDLFVVPDDSLPVDVLIGDDVFSRPGIVVTGDSSGIRLKSVEGNCCVLNSTSSTSETVISDSDVVTPLEGTEKQQLLELINDYKSLFTSGNRVGAVNTGCLNIRLKEDKVIRYQPYRLSLDERRRVASIVEDLKRNGIIRDSHSPYASPVILVKKKNGTDRLCVDFRALNRITVKDRFPLPLIEDQLDKLGKGKLFISLDMAAGFLQIPVHEDSIEKTAFVTPDGQYEYLRMPFGLANAPSVFQRAIGRALDPLIREGIVLLYLDDILIPATSVMIGMQHLRKTFEALHQAGFSINIDKCKFFVTTIEYLGREISSEGIRPSRGKAEALLKSPVPKNVREVRQFMGLASYFRKFIPSFAEKTACITALTKSTIPWHWGEAQTEARNYLISILTSRPVLAVFDPELPTELHTDASSLGYGAILMQQRDKKMCVVSYFSRRTQPNEAKYHSYELETLAIYNALKHFRVYLLGIHFTIVTDCNAVKATATKKDLLPRIARWWMFMQDFDFSIVYRKGAKLRHVDYFSRNIPVLVARQEESWIRVQQRQDPETAQLIEKFNKGELDETQYLWDNGSLYHLDYMNGEAVRQWYVPKFSRLGLLRIFHDEQCHVGYEKTLASIYKYFWFPGIRRFVRKYVDHCLRCKTTKVLPKVPRGYLTQVQKPSTPFETIHVDYLGPLYESEGNSFVFVMVDGYSKYCLLYALPNTTAEACEPCLKNFVSLFGTPKLIIADECPAFKSKQIRETLKRWCINLHLTTPYLHRGNGQVERYMFTIANMMRVEARKETGWASVLWKIQLVLNSTVQKTTGYSPLHLLLDCTGTIPVVRALLNNFEQDPKCTSRTLRAVRRQEVVEKLHANSCNQKKLFDRHRRRLPVISVGDFVLVEAESTSKLGERDLGPYEVLEVLANGRYKLRHIMKRRSTVCAAEQIYMWPTEWIPADVERMFSAEESSDEEDSMPLSERLARSCVLK